MRGVSSVGGSGWGVAGRRVRAVFLAEVVDLGRRLRLMAVVVVGFVNAGDAGRASACSSVRPPMRMWPAVTTFRPITGMMQLVR